MEGASSLAAMRDRGGPAGRRLALRWLSSAGSPAASLAGSGCSTGAGSVDNAADPSVAKTPGRFSAAEVRARRGSPDETASAPGAAPALDIAAVAAFAMEAFCGACVDGAGGGVLPVLIAGGRGGASVAVPGCLGGGGGDLASV